MKTIGLKKETLEEAAEQASLYEANGTSAIESALSIIGVDEEHISQINTDYLIELARDYVSELADDGHDTAESLETLRNIKLELNFILVDYRRDKANGWI